MCIPIKYSTLRCTYSLDSLKVLESSCTQSPLFNTLVYLLLVASLPPFSGSSPFIPSLLPIENSAQSPTACSVIVWPWAPLTESFSDFTLRSQLGFDWCSLCDWTRAAGRRGRLTWLTDAFQCCGSGCPFCLFLWCWGWESWPLC